MSLLIAIIFYSQVKRSCCGTGARKKCLFSICLLWIWDSMSIFKAAPVLRCSPTRGSFNRHTRAGWSYGNWLTPSLHLSRQSVSQLRRTRAMGGHQGPSFRPLQIRGGGCQSCHFTASLWIPIDMSVLQIRHPCTWKRGQVLVTEVHSCWYPTHLDMQQAP